MAASTDLVTTEEVKVYLGISGSDHDTLIAELIDIISEEVEDYCGTYFSSVEVTEDLDGGDEFLLTTRAPIISITSITDNRDSTVVDSDDYDFYANSGMIFKKEDLAVLVDSELNWPRGRKRYQVVANIGHSAVPETIKLVCYQWISRNLKIIPTQNAPGLWTGENFVETTEKKSDKKASMITGFTAEEHRILSRYMVSKGLL